MQPKINPKVALANSYMDHFIKVTEKHQRLWMKTPRGYCHLTMKESKERAKWLKQQATALYQEALE